MSNARAFSFLVLTCIAWALSAMVMLGDVHNIVVVWHSALSGSHQLARMQATYMARIQSIINGHPKVG